MNQAFATRLTTELAAVPGIGAVALVDATSGLLLHCQSRAHVDPGLWEAAVDYWRLHARRASHFESLGRLGAAVLHHELGMLCVLPLRAADDLLVVCLAGHQTVNWIDWQRKLHHLAAELGDF